jgi:hypothetical protein
VQCHAALDHRDAADGSLTCWAAVLVVGLDVDEVTVIEQAGGFVVGRFSGSACALVPSKSFTRFSQSPFFSTGGRGSGFDWSGLAAAAGAIASASGGLTSGLLCCAASAGGEMSSATVTATYA